MIPKTPLLLATGLLIIVGATAWFLTRGDGTEHFGKEFDPAVPAVSLTEVIAKPESALDKDLRVSGKITRQCPSAGCWFILKSDKNTELKIEMSDYTPNLPQHLGHEATVEGRLIRYGDRYEFIGKAVEFHKP